MKQKHRALAAADGGCTHRDGGLSSEGALLPRGPGHRAERWALPHPLRHPGTRCLLLPLPNTRVPPEQPKLTPALGLGACCVPQPLPGQLSAQPPSRAVPALASPRPSVYLIGYWHEMPREPRACFSHCAPQHLGQVLATRCSERPLTPSGLPTDLRPHC